MVCQPEDLRQAYKTYIERLNLGLKPHFIWPIKDAIKMQEILSERRWRDGGYCDMRWGNEDWQPAHQSLGVCVRACVSGTSINRVMNAQTNPYRCLTAPFSST